MFYIIIFLLALNAIALLTIKQQQNQIRRLQHKINPLQPFYFDGSEQYFDDADWGIIEDENI